MPYDVIEVLVRNINRIPIVWQTLSDRVSDNSNRRSIRLRNFVNEPSDETTFALATGYTLPSDWTFNSTGRLRYRPILGQTINLKFTAMRQGVPNVDSNEFSITRRQAFIERLVPNRIVLALGFNQTTQRVYILNTTDIGVTPVRNFINSFDIDGNEQLSESIELADSVIPRNNNGMTFDGTHFYLCGKDGSFYGGTGYLNKIDTDGDLAGEYTYSGGWIESLTFDGTSLWGLDVAPVSGNYGLRKFSTIGVEDTEARLNLPNTSWYLSRAQYGLGYGDSCFWIPQANTHIRCLNADGTRDTIRDISVQAGVAGVTFNNTTENLWWIRDLEDDDENRYGVLEAEHV